MAISSLSNMLYCISWSIFRLGSRPRILKTLQTEYVRLSVNSTKAGDTEPTKNPNHPTHIRIDSRSFRRIRSCNNALRVALTSSPGLLQECLQSTESKTRPADMYSEQSS